MTHLKEKVNLKEQNFVILHKFCVIGDENGASDVLFCSEILMR
jgi:hypothetical protein